MFEQHNSSFQKILAHEKTILPKVKRTAFTRLNPTGLSEFTHGVLKATQGVERYKIAEGLVAELDAAVQTLDKLIAERYNAGKLDNQLSTIAVNDVKDLLQRFVLLLEANANGEPDYLVSAGFQCVQNRGARRNMMLNVPMISSLRATLVSGQIEIVLAECRGARSFAFESSYDNGKVWHNGMYSSKLRNRFQVDTNDEVLVRTKGIGASNAVSEFCAPMGCRVL